jgi:hypothetical protein
MKAYVSASLEFRLEIQSFKTTTPDVHEEL